MVQMYELGGRWYTEEELLHWTGPVYPVSQPQPETPPQPVFTPEQISGILSSGQAQTVEAAKSILGRQGEQPQVYVSDMGDETITIYEPEKIVLETPGGPVEMPEGIKPTGTEIWIGGPEGGGMTLIPGKEFAPTFAPSETAKSVYEMAAEQPVTPIYAPEQSMIEAAKSANMIESSIIQGMPSTISLDGITSGQRTATMKEMEAAAKTFEAPKTFFEPKGLEQFAISAITVPFAAGIGLIETGITLVQKGPIETGKKVVESYAELGRGIFAGEPAAWGSLAGQALWGYGLAKAIEGPSIKQVDIGEIGKVIENEAGKFQISKIATKAGGKTYESTAMTRFFEEGETQYSISDVATDIGGKIRESIGLAKSKPITIGESWRLASAMPEGTVIDLSGGYMPSVMKGISVEKLKSGFKTTEIAGGYLSKQTSPGITKILGGGLEEGGIKFDYRGMITAQEPSKFSFNILKPSAQATTTIKSAVFPSLASEIAKSQVLSASTASSAYAFSAVLPLSAASLSMVNLPKKMVEAPTAFSYVPSATKNISISMPSLIKQAEAPKMQVLGKVETMKIATPKVGIMQDIYTTPSAKKLKLVEEETFIFRPQDIEPLKDLGEIPAIQPALGVNFSQIGANMQISAQSMATNIEMKRDIASSTSLRNEMRMMSLLVQTHIPASLRDVSMQPLQKSMQKQAQRQQELQMTAYVPKITAPHITPTTTPRGLNLSFPKSMMSKYGLGKIKPQKIERKRTYAYTPSVIGLTFYKPIKKAFKGGSIENIGIRPALKRKPNMEFQIPFLGRFGKIKLKHPKSEGIFRALGF